MPDAYKTDRKPQSDPEAHIKIKIICEDRVYGSHSLVPAIQDPISKEHRVGHHRYQEPEETSDHGPEGKYHTNEQESQIQLKSSRHRR